MKNPERVAELLAELRELADNDFERHRIDVLERDLTDPPTVEIIDDTHQRFNGFMFKKNHSGHYSLNAQIHRSVWTYYYGEIPDNCHIHHIDMNCANNSVENLQCLTNSEHMRLHHQNGIHGVVKQFICAQCGKTFESTVANSRFCSRACSTIFYHGKETVEKVCSLCGKKFSTRRQNQEFCSKQCSAKNQFKDHREKRICPVCGKEFEVKKSLPNKCCSRSCGNKYDWQRRKQEI